MYHLCRLHSISMDDLKLVATLGGKQSLKGPKLPVEVSVRSIACSIHLCLSFFLLLTRSLTFLPSLTYSNLLSLHSLIPLNSIFPRAWSTPDYSLSLLLSPSLTPFSLYFSSFLSLLPSLPSPSFSLFFPLPPFFFSSLYTYFPLSASLSSSYLSFLSLSLTMYQSFASFLQPYSQTSSVSTPGDPPNCYSLSVVLANHIRRFVLWVISWGVISLYFLTSYYSLTVFLLTRFYCMFTCHALFV